MPELWPRTILSTFARNTIVVIGEIVILFPKLPPGEREPVMMRSSGCSKSYEAKRVGLLAAVPLFNDALSQHWSLYVDFRASPSVVFP